MFYSLPFRKLQEKAFNQFNQSGLKKRLAAIAKRGKFEHKLALFWLAEWRHEMFEPITIAYGFSRHYADLQTWAMGFMDSFLVQLTHLRVNGRNVFNDTLHNGAYIPRLDRVHPIPSLHAFPDHLDTG